MTDENDGQRKAERNAQEFGGRQPEGTALIDGPQREQEMHRKSAIEQRGAGHAVPDVLRVSERFLGGVERNEAERVID